MRNQEEIQERIAAGRASISGRCWVHMMIWAFADIADGGWICGRGGEDSSCLNVAEDESGVKIGVEEAEEDILIDGRVCWIHVEEEVGRVDSFVP